MNKRTLILSTITLGTLIAGFTLWGQDRSPQKEAPKPPSGPYQLRAEGRVCAYPGADVTVGTDLGGTITQMLVQEGDHVRKGQSLALIDARQETAALREAQSRVRELTADERFQETECQRSQALHFSGITSSQSLDQAKTLLDLARARREAAQATADRLQVTISKLRVEAPIDGAVVTRYANAGETVTPGAKLLQIAQTDRRRIEAEIDEFDLSRVRLEDLVEVRAEGYPAAWKGHVEEIPQQVVGRKLKPQDPARPSDTRVLIVKVALEAKTPLKLGQRVELNLHPAT